MYFTRHVHEVVHVVYSLGYIALDAAVVTVSLPINFNSPVFCFFSMFKPVQTLVLKAYRWPRIDWSCCCLHGKRKPLYWSIIPCFHPKRRRTRQQCSGTCVAPSLKWSSSMIHLVNWTQSYRELTYHRPASPKSFKAAAYFQSEP